ncbi:heme oxygenase 1 [Ochlerotatus camptorhynchus]|uniref:heme oxygenase 1 n=1 Tax=Ochlerotatus camptorhynchus TaxID=644619 RepID=UPI0031D36692
MASSKMMSFTKEMRVATRDIHNVSDALVNAKLAFALYDSAVWAEGLLIFYEIFKYLEQNVSHDFLPEEYHRTQQFEEDLQFYLGTDWKAKHQPRKEVCDYIKHLEKIQRENSNLLVAYVYHLYMGLLSGGQILQKRRNISKKFNPFASKGKEGAALTTFEDHSIYELKQKMRKTIDDFGVRLDDDTKMQLIEESRKVFEMNNEIIKTVKGVNRANLKTLGYILLIIVAYLILKFLMTK